MRSASGSRAAGVAVAVGYGRGAEAAEAAVAAIELTGGRAVAVQGDAASPQACRRVADLAEDQLGPIDILVPNPGVARAQAPEQVELEDWEHLLAVNLRAPFLLAQRITPGMRSRGWGRVLFMSSVAAYRGSALGPHYAASKAGLLGLTRDFAARLASSGVTVNALAPALIADTAMVASSPSLLRQMPPIGRFGDSAEVADLALAALANGYLSNQPSVSTGVSIPVDDAIREDGIHLPQNAERAGRGDRAGSGNRIQILTATPRPDTFSARPRQPPPRSPI